jgi:putative cardiolipin synthase
MSIRYLATMKFYKNRTIIIVLVLMIAGCVNGLHKHAEIDKAVTALIDTEINCSDIPDGTCAIPSELHEMAEQGLAGFTSEEPQHFVSILNIGQDALLARLHLIRAAKKSIELQTYIWANDEVGRLIFFELLQAARRGVKVRVIVDQITVEESPDLLARLATAHVNLEISFYNPTFSRGKTTPLTLSTGALFSFSGINQRMHNKVFVVDELIGIVGGRNIENKYYDYSPTYNFKDRDVLVIGPVVAQMSNAFERYWNDEIVVKAVYLVDVGQEVVKLNESNQSTLMDKPDFSLFKDIDLLANQYSVFKYRPAIKPFLTSRVEYSADLPGKPTGEEKIRQKDISNALRDVIGSAQKSLTIQTPYFVLSRTANREFKQLLRQNPNLQFRVSSNSLASTDLTMIYAITFKQKRDVIKNLKVNLYELRPFPADIRKYIPRYDQLVVTESSELYDDPSKNDDSLPIIQKGPRIGMHAKSIVVDGKIAIIGSHNFDPRSISINTESAVIIWDENVARALEQNIILDTEPQNSWVIAKQESVPFISHFSNILGSISSMMPVFDIWPFQYTSSYQLKEGMEMMPSDHPDFYKNYEDVGQFPEVNLSSNAVRARLIKSFGGFIAPLM